MNGQTGSNENESPWKSTINLPCHYKTYAIECWNEKKKHPKKIINPFPPQFQLICYRRWERQGNVIQCSKGSPTACWNSGRIWPTIHRSWTRRKICRPSACKFNSFFLKGAGSCRILSNPKRVRRTAPHIPNRLVPDGSRAPSLNRQLHHENRRQQEHVNRLGYPPYSHFTP